MSTDFPLSALIVDDNHLSQKLLMKQLQAVGVERMDAEFGGAAALARLAQTRYDIVIFDWNMPEMDGLAFLRGCRKLDSFADTAFMLVSAESDSQKLLQILSEGATSYLTKPVMLPDLQDRITRMSAWLGQKRQREAQ